MQKLETPIAGAYIIELDCHPDERGYFVESYNRDKFRELGILDDFIQDNHSKSRKGVLRGLHFQFPPRAMSKMVRWPCKPCYAARPSPLKIRLRYRLRK